MSYIPVIDSTILSRQTVTAKDGRTLNILELSYPGFTYEPGQFVMIQKQNNGFHWSYPYMVYEATPQSLKIAASKTSSLFDSCPNDAVAIWGANGKACNPGEHSLFVAEPATFHLLAPLIRACNDPNLIILGSKDSVPEKLLPGKVRFIQDNTQAPEELYTDPSSVYMALNIPNLEAIMKEADASLKKRTTLFVSTRIGCGIGACRSCYLHSPNIQMGIPVCCNGPYLPYVTIDFEKDRKCFQIFR